MIHALDSVVVIAFAGNALAGALLVWLVYAGYERSVVGGLAAGATFGAAAVLTQRRIGRSHVEWHSWAHFEATLLAAVAGAVFGVALVMVTFKPRSPADAPANRPTTPTEE